MRINTLEDLDKALDNGAYAWPGGYPVFFVMADGEAMSFKALEDNRELAAQTFDLDADPHDEWRPIALEINWEDAALYCAHTDERIESAYAEDEVTA